MQRFNQFLILAVVINLQVNYCLGQSFQFKDCYAILKNDTLTIGNNKIRNTFSWNDGSLELLTVEGVNIQTKISGLKRVPDLFLPHEIKGTSPEFSGKEVRRFQTENPFLQIEIKTAHNSLGVKRIFEIHPNIPALATYYLFKGTSLHTWGAATENTKELIEDASLLSKTPEGQARLGSIGLQGKHWKLSIISFNDVTDRNNTLVQEGNYVLYKQPLPIKGNLLFAENKADKKCFFILKESPLGFSQLAYPGFDFIASQDRIDITGLGLSASDINDSTWVRSYGFVIGVSSANRVDQLMALHEYQKTWRMVRTNRDQMILMNTWGDRGQDSRINETFVLKELELASKLGITHLQLDDGWQAGISKNSARKGKVWDSWTLEDWKPHPDRFPNGLDPVVAKAKSLNMEIGLWFNPGKNNQYRTWQRDADILTDFYKRYGIRTFKIDGVELNEKMAEENLRKLLDKVMTDTDGAVVFNLDVTAGTRPGYFYFTEFGNVFLENRYTDWSNYYPHWTLRNLWMLSRYIPAERFQIEFLNKWRNTTKYPDGDYLAPGKIPFDYLVAITLMAQPLAWLEAGNLPAEAFSVQSLLKKYKDIQHEMHQGIILPIGEEPDGHSWTGFQSIHGTKGYLIVFREFSESYKKSVSTFFSEGTKVSFKPLLGSGKSFKAVADSDGRILFSLPHSNSFCLYEYESVVAFER